MQRDALLLAIARTDRTFQRALLPARGVCPPRTAWKGRCLYCDTPIWLELGGAAITDVSVEHLLPRARGGTDDLRNLALACSRCNQEKGRRHDASKRSARADDVIAAAITRRAERWRDAEE
jgi:5-methylcytosine-specific restriction endonuclease McrA